MALKRFWTWMGGVQGIWNLLALVAGVLATIVGIADASSGLYSAGIAAVLSLLAAASLVAGANGFQRGRDIDRLGDLLREQFGEKPDFRVRSQLPTLQARVKGARECVRVRGLSLGTIMRDVEDWRKLMRSGIRVELGLLPREWGDLHRYVASYLDVQEGFRSDLEYAWSCIDELRKMPEAAKRLDVREVNFVPTLSYMAVDATQPNGQIVVDLIPYRCTPSNRPAFLLTPEKQPTWYDYFRSSLDKEWQSMACCHRPQDPEGSSMGTGE